MDPKSVLLGLWEKSVGLSKVQTRIPWREIINLTIYLPVPDRISPFFTWGGRGVQWFFVLSGYFACHSFIPKTGIASYYKKRAICILPSYYVAIIVIMLFYHLVLSDVTPDIFGIGWLRYFLGLNTVLPSTNYDLWNNHSLQLWRIGYGRYSQSPCSDVGTDQAHQWMPPEWHDRCFMDILNFCWSTGQVKTWPMNSWQIWHLGAKNSNLSKIAYKL